MAYMVQPHCSNFRLITTNFSGVRIFRIFTIFRKPTIWYVIIFLGTWQSLGWTRKNCSCILDRNFCLTDWGKRKCCFTMEVVWRLAYSTLTSLSNIFKSGLTSVYTKNTSVWHLFSAKHGDVNNKKKKGAEPQCFSDKSRKCGIKQWNR